MPPNSQVRHIKIEVSSRGDETLKQISRELGNMSKQVKSTSGTIGLLSRGLGTLFAANVFGFGISEITQMSDSMELLKGRISGLTGSSEEGSKAMGLLFDAAQRVKAPVDAVASVFARLKAATGDLGLSTESLIGFTETLQNSFRLSGASAGEASSAAIQLSQGLASGQLRGQELRAVLEANVEVGNALQKSLGLARGELYKFAEAGKLTSRVALKALSESAEDINTRAKNLGQTFEQTVIVQMNKLKNAVGELNEKFKLSEGFASFAETVGNKFTLILTTLTVTSIPALIAVLQKLGIALLSFGKSNPVTLALGAISLAIVYLVEDLDSLIQKFRDLGSGIIDFSNKVAERFSGNKIKAAIADFLGSSETLAEREKRFANDAAFNEKLRGDAIGLRMKSFRDAEAAYDEAFAKRKDTGKTGMKADTKEIFDYKAQLSELNKEFNSGLISTREYSISLKELEIKKVQDEMGKGQATLLDLNKAMRDLRFDELSRDFNEGRISVTQYNSAVSEIKLQELNEKFNSGKVSVQEYNKELLKTKDTLFEVDMFSTAAKVGITDYLETIGSVGTQVAGAIENAFQGLEDGFMEFMKTGTQDWKKFAQDILDDISRIILRMTIIKPLAGAALDFAFAGGSAASGGGGFGGSSLYDGGSSKLSSAVPTSVVPQSFVQYGDSGSQGKVGGDTYVNVTNNSNASISTEEKTGPNGERIIEVMIQNKIKDGIISGAFDKQFGQSFGLKRRGQ